VRSVDDTLNALQDELRIVEASLAEPDVASDLTRLRDLSRRHKELSEINVAWNELKAVQEDYATAKEMFNESSGDDREQWREEMNNAEGKIPLLESTLETLLLPRDPNEGRNVIIEIRGAEGGEEANLFAGDLADMTWHFADGSSTSLNFVNLNRVDLMKRRSSLRVKTHGPDSSMKLEFTACSACPLLKRRVVFTPLLRQFQFSLKPKKLMLR